MNAKYLLTWGIVVGFGLGAVAISGLKAQTKPDTYDPPGYVVVEVTFKNQDEDKERYIREFFPQHHQGNRGTRRNICGARRQTYVVPRIAPWRSRCHHAFPGHG